MSGMDLFGWNGQPPATAPPAGAFEANQATHQAEGEKIAPAATPAAFDGLREYQIDSLRRIWAEVEAGRRRPLLVASTGSGKTVMAAALVRQATERRQRVLFMVHRRELVRQTSTKLYDVGIDSGTIQAGMPMRLAEPVQVASIQTLHARAIRGSAIELPKADLVIVDEAHHIRAKSWRAIVDEYPAAVIVGLTATPCRGDGRGLGAIFDVMVEAIPTDELIKQGHLVPTKVYAPATPDLKDVKIQAGDYVENQLSKAVDQPQLVGDIVMHWLKLAARRKTVVFAVDVAHSVHIRDEFRRASVVAEHIDGTTPTEERDRILKDLSQGKIEVVSNCMVLTEGWDQPDVACLVLARPTKHMGLYRQMVGRVLRPSPGKDHALVLDHAGCTFQHGFAEEAVTWTLREDARAENKAHNARQEKRKSALTTCPECKAVRQAGSACPACGWRPMSRPGAADVAEGELTEYGRDKQRAKAQATLEEKTRFYAQLLWMCRERGYRPGWAAHKYKEKFQVWPAMRPESVEPMEPDPIVRSWVRSRQIAWAKAQQRGQQ